MIYYTYTTKFLSVLYFTSYKRPRVESNTWLSSSVCTIPRPSTKSHGDRDAVFAINTFSSRFSAPFSLLNLHHVGSLVHLGSMWPMVRAAGNLSSIAGDHIFMAAVTEVCFWFTCGCFWGTSVICRWWFLQKFSHRPSTQNICLSASSCAPSGNSNMLLSYSVFSLIIWLISKEISM